MAKMRGRKGSRRYRMQEAATRTISDADLARYLGCEPGALPPECFETAASLDFRHRVLQGGERDAVFLRVLKTLSTPLEKSGPDRLHQWEQGWGENLREFEESGFDPQTLIPKFIKNEVKRLGGHYIQPESRSFEMDFVQVLWQFLFRSYFDSSNPVYEFGCGPGQNLLALSKLYPRKKLYGLDWAKSSLEIVRRLKSNLGVNVEARKFNLFHPDETLRLEPGSGVFTAGALEQTGENVHAFLDWLLQQPFSICVNVETLHEVYDPNDLFDYVARCYIEKRGYLRGYLTALRQLQERGEIQIIKVHRVFGSLFNDVYTYVAWKRK